MLCITGCTIPIRLIPDIDSRELRNEERVYQEELHKKKIEKPPTEYEVMMHFFSNDEQCIIKAFEKKGCDAFIISKWFNTYKAKNVITTFDGFGDYIINMFDDKIRLDILEDFIADAKQSYNLLKDMQAQGYDVLKQPNTNINKEKLKLLIRDALKKEGLNISIENDRFQRDTTQ